MLLAERHHGLIAAIRGLLETVSEAVMMVADANSLFEGAERLQPSLAVVELSLSRDDGFGLLQELRSRCPELKVIALSMYDEPTVVRQALESGANGYVLKSAIATDLLPAVESVLAGHCYVSPGVPVHISGGLHGRASSSKERT